MVLSHQRLIMLSGALWLCVGMILLPFGIFLLLNHKTLSSSEETTVALIAIALFVGHLKGRFVLGKSSNRIVSRIRSLPNPTHVTNVFGLPYLLLMGSMILLGISIKYFGVSNDIRGVIDIAVGAALINGSVMTFRHL